MTAFAPEDDRPPVTDDLGEPAAYRAHIADVVRRTYDLGRGYRRKGNQYAWLGVVLAFAASATGFMTAVVDNAWLGIVPGVLGAAAGSVAGWARRAHFDGLAAANEQLFVELEHQLRQYDARAGEYRVTNGESEAAGSRAFQLFCRAV